LQIFSALWLGVLKWPEAVVDVWLAVEPCCKRIVGLIFRTAVKTNKQKKNILELQQRKR